MKSSSIILVAVIGAVLAALVTVKLFVPQTAAPVQAKEEKKETVFDRVMRTRTLRCAYTPYPPFMIKDANTGKLSGIYYDVMAEMGKRLNLKIEWPEEVAPAGMFEGFKSNRYDAICAGYTRNPARSLQGDFSAPVFYFSYSIFVRADDTRFDNDRTLLNDTSRSFTTIDGELANYILDDEFPKAQRKSLPDAAMSDASIRLVNVATQKSDATIIETAIGADYMHANPGKIKPLIPPLSVLPSNIIIPMDQLAFKEMLDAGISNLNETHFVQKVIRKYTSGDGYYEPSAPFAPRDMSTNGVK